MKKAIKKKSGQTLKPKRQKPLRFDAISIFPEVFDAYMSASILGRAQKSKLIAFAAHDLRKWTHDRHSTVDDKPFGGGPGMVMKPQPFLEALVSLGVRTRRGAPRAPSGKKKTRVIVTAANGKAFSHADAIRLSKYDRVVFLCGRYEGIDQRVIDRLADESMRIGEYVLTGGELPAMVMMDAIARQIPGVLGKEASLEEESWADAERRSAIGDRLSAAQDPSGRKPKAPSDALGAGSSRKPASSPPTPSTTTGSGEYPQYTRPEVWLGMKVPEVLMSGNHQKIKEWREGKRERR